MKVIHTSDWHLGQEFYSYDRTEEHLAFFSQLAQIVHAEQPDVLVISGDIYHNATPSNAVMRLFTDQLDVIRRACSTMQIVVIAWNHDSSSRLEVNRTLWEHLGVYVIGKIAKTDEGVDFDQHILRIYDKDGELTGYVVAVPHLFMQSYPQIVEGTSRENRPMVFFQALGERLAVINQEKLPVVMMAHMAMSGSDITGHDIIQGGMEYMNIADLKVDFDYLALGHIHCPQQIGDYPARYCGTPIPVSFDENYGHSVTVVELGKKGDLPQLNFIPIINPWPLKTLPKEAVPFDEAMEALAAFPDDEKAYIRLHVRLADVPPHNALEKAFQLVEGKSCRFCCFKWERSNDRQVNKSSFVDVNHIKAQSPVDIADLFYQSRFGQPMDNELKDMLIDVVNQVTHIEK